jgi:hypothetical protein
MESKHNSESDNETKRSYKDVTLADEIKIPDKLRGGMSAEQLASQSVDILF